jgi:hypothetical protein
MNLNFSNVILIGLGGTGSYLVSPLSRYLSYNNLHDNLYLFDGDRVEPHNLQRQNLINRDGKFKLDCLIIEDPYDRVVKKKTYLNYLYDSQHLTNGLNLIISCVDNNRTRHDNLNSLHSSCRDWIYITPGNSDTKGQVVSYARINGEYVGIDPFDLYPDWEYPDDYSPQFRPREDGCGRVVESAPQTLIANMTAANLTMTVLYHLVENNVLIDCYSFDLNTGQYGISNVYKLPEYSYIDDNVAVM